MTKNIPESELAYFDRPEVRERLKKPAIVYALGVALTGMATFVTFASTSNWLYTVGVFIAGIIIVQLVAIPSLKRALGNWQEEMARDEAAGRSHKDTTDNTIHGIPTL